MLLVLLRLSASWVRLEIDIVSVWDSFELADYADLSAINFDSEPIPPGQEREPIDTQEAIRLITLKLRISKIEPPGEDDGQMLPVVHYTGSSRSMHTSWDPNANSKIRGDSIPHD